MKFLRHLACFFAAVTLMSAAEIPKTTPADAAKRITAGQAVLVDVREPSEWADTGVAAPAVLLAKSDFDGAQKDWKPFLEKNAGKEIILYCRSGARADTVGATLAERGLKVSNAGGFRDWTKAGLPTRPVAAPK
ncbi:MAG: rhodanese-like domain-containing protein [Verrucomicrobia bacterium]|nr:rhodanese-like domain-containing protein [Verrucomicrobiota bacterium]